MGARVAVPAATHVLIRKGTGSFHAAVPVAEPAMPAGVSVILGGRQSGKAGRIVYRTACGEELRPDGGTLLVWRGQGAMEVLERAVDREPAKVCKRCDRVGSSLGDTRA